jgi:microcin C transport system permease protein
MIPTLLGITLICFILIQFVPGGPVEQQISKVRGMSSSRGGTAKSISEAEIANISLLWF